MNLFALNSPSITGEVLCPGDKSISQRAVIIGSLINQDMTIEGFLNGEDPISTINALNAIGSSIEINNTSVTIKQRETAFISPKEDVDLGNSGTGMRLMMGLISSLGINVRLVGDKSLSKRPMLRVSEPLNSMGANILCRDGMPPVQITKGNIKSNFSYDMPIASAQVKSSIILAALAANESVTVKEKYQTRNHTEKMIDYFGGSIKSEIIDRENVIYLSPSKLDITKSYKVVGDFSSAAFLMVAGLIAKESNIIIKNVGVNPTRSGLIDILKSMGGEISIRNQEIICNEEVADIHVQSSALKGINIKGSIIPNIIDEIPVLSIAAAFADGQTTISEASELRVKESDRLSAISYGLNSIGKSNELFEDGIKINGSKDDISGIPEIDSFGDHRIAMSFLVASLRSPEGIHVRDCANIFTSFPGFIDVMQSLGVSINET